MLKYLIFVPGMVAVIILVATAGDSDLGRITPGQTAARILVSMTLIGVSLISAQVAEQIERRKQ